MSLRQSLSPAGTHRRVLANVLQARLLSSRESTPEPQKTCLYDFHVENGGKMVDFAGYLVSML